MATSETGPFLVMAALCEQTIEAKDGRVSVINMIEQVTQRQGAGEAAEEMTPFTFAVKVVVALKAGSAQGRYAIRIQPEDPIGMKLAAIEQPVQFTGGPSSGVRLIGDLRLKLEREGLYWIDVVLVRGRGEAKAEERLTRIPLRVVYQPRLTASAPEAES